jgi:hypothetical protein
MGMLRFKPENQFVERCHSIVSYAFNIENLILIFFFFFFFVIYISNKDVANKFY